MPFRNRVTPESELVAIPLRGAWTGNRGIVHEGSEIVWQWASHHWLICALEYRGLRRPHWLPARLTRRVFHDEAVALAAGHRPCALCRRGAYNAYRSAWAGSPSADEIDRRLQAERLVSRTRRRRTHEVPW